MERELFQGQVNRLAAVFGKQHYPPERVSLLWRAFNTENGQDFVAATDRLIATARNYPLEPEITQALDAVYRERIEIEARESRIHGAGGFVETVEKWAEGQAAELPSKCVELLRRRFARGMPDDDFQKGLALLHQAAEHMMGKTKCRECDGTGWSHVNDPKGNAHTARCDCPLGDLGTQYFTVRVSKTETKEMKIPRVSELKKRFGETSKSRRDQAAKNEE